MARIIHIAQCSRATSTTRATGHLTGSRATSMSRVLPSLHGVV